MPDFDLPLSIRRYILWGRDYRMCLTSCFSIKTVKAISACLFIQKWLLMADRPSVKTCQALSTASPVRSKSSAPPKTRANSSNLSSSSYSAPTASSSLPACTASASSNTS